jgi:hypothetical protein
LHTLPNSKASVTIKIIKMRIFDNCNGGCLDRMVEK